MPDSITEGKPRAVSVVIPTYNRVKILGKTIALLHQNLQFPGEVHYVIGNDGEEIDYDDFVNLVNHEVYKLHEGLAAVERSNVRIIPGPKRGLGANLNNALEHATTNLVLQMDDDHWLVKELDITDYARDILNPELNIGWIRLFMGEREDVYSLSTYYKFKAALYGPYWYVDTESPELYIASNRPHIKHIRFHRAIYGWYDEDKTLGKTEESFCHRYKRIRNNQPWERYPWVAVPMFGLALGQWDHVGESWQKQGF
jgi:glycosyltransferase involved in cell wall biosynthesis